MRHEMRWNRNSELGASKTDGVNHDSLRRNFKDCGKLNRPCFESGESSKNSFVSIFKLGNWLEYGSISETRTRNFGTGFYAKNGCLRIFSRP